MSKQLIAAAPRQARIALYEELPIRPDEVKVKVTHASPKHGSELAAFRGESPHLADRYDEDWRLFLPRDPNGRQEVVFGDWNLGNQWVGEIIEAGSEVRDYRVGEKVCGYGGIREFHNVKAVDNFYLLKMPDNMPWQNAVCLDPAIFALGGVRDGHVRPGDRVAVIGLGAIGQIAVQIAKLAGASYVAAVDPIESRRAVALRNGADRAFDSANEDVGLMLKQDTNKLGVDAIIETSANEFALNQALRGLAYGGTIAYVGWARPFKGGMDWGREAHFNNARIVFSRSCSEPNPDHPRWSFRRIEETCWNMLKSGAIDCADIIHPIVPFNEADTAYETFVDREPARSIKLGIDLIS
ncbi:zinc-dependent alcohol dehydrogenase [Cohnella herbarum]|uniref:Zinc-binding dehydrogenase n=1 Tax=Cohnella herbarum TaxID=2728023 RepID=A0A7Z2VPN1_9BACL|nr:zinc-binding dehydrogenase [Cohnella herbarum]QJD86785.1 zinc-binding dehydrogenase [Cohnella herbarum]